MIIVSQPSWEGTTFHDNMGEDECTRFLAKRGITLDKADDCHDFTYTWIQENNTPDEKDMQLPILLSQTVVRLTPTPLLNPGANLYCTGSTKPTQGGCQSYHHLCGRQAMRMASLQLPLGV